MTQRRWALVDREGLITVLWMRPLFCLLSQKITLLGAVGVLLPHKSRRISTQRYHLLSLEAGGDYHTLPEELH